MSPPKHPSIEDTVITPRRDWGWYVERFGLPTVICLMLMGVIFYSGRWVASEIIKPAINSHLELMKTQAETNASQAATLAGQGVTHDRQIDLQKTMIELQNKSLLNHERIIDNQRMIIRILDRKSADDSEGAAMPEDWGTKPPAE